jgi:hypothetical protein
MFQIETVAQVRDEKTVVIAVDYSHILTATTTDKELKELERNFTNENQKLLISNVKRNKKGEIIEIKLTFDTGKSYVEILERKSSEPINNIKIFIKEDENGTRESGFEELKEKVIVGKYNTANEKGEIETDGQHYTIDKMVKNGKRMHLIIDGKLQKEGTKIAIPMDREIEIEREITAKQAKEKYNIEAKEGEMFYEITTKPETVKLEKEAVYAVAVAEYSENDSYNHIDKIKQNKLVDAKKALILFNGKEISYKDLDKIDEKTISSSGNSGAKHAVKKYGDKAKNGVIFINTKEYDMENNPLLKEMYEKVENEKNAQIKEENTNKSGWGISYHVGEPNAEKLIEDVTKSSSVDYKKAILILNGKAIDSKELNSINMTSIGKIEAKVANPELISQYGERAKNGVVFINYKDKNANDTNSNLRKEKTEPKTIELKNGDVVVVFDGDKIKFPGYPTHFLNRLKIESKGKILEDNIEFFKNYDLKKIKDIKIELESDSKESKVIKKLYIIE